MKNILIPTDFSENAWNALKYGIHLFEDEQCTFHLLHTYSPNAYSYDFNSNMGVVGAATMEGQTDMVYQASQEGLNKIFKRIKIHNYDCNHVYNLISAYDTLTDKINELIEDVNINLVIMGKKGLTSTEKMFLGSNTLQVLRTAKCAVLTIPENFGFRYIDNILFSSDYKYPYAKNEVYPIVELANLNAATVHTLHIHNEPELSKEQQQNRDTINAYFCRIKHDFQEVPHARTFKTIMNYVEEHQIGMLALTRRKHSFLERLLFKQSVNAIGMHLKIPFLMLPVK